MRRRIIHFGLLAAVSFAPVFFFYWHCEQLSKKLEATAHFKEGKANAVKHAYAGGLVFTFLTDLAIGEENAVRAVVSLGHVNEYAEQVIRYCNGKQRDSTAEMIKDLHNNHVGITAARWRIHHPEQVGELPLDALMIQIAEDGVLITDNRMVVVVAPEDQYDVALAIAKDDKNSAATVAATEAALEKRFPVER